MSLIKQILFVFLHYYYIISILLYYYITVSLFHSLLRYFKVFIRDQLQQIFECNNDPVTSVNQCVRTFLNQIFVPKKTFINLPKKDLLILLPFSCQLPLNLNKTPPKCIQSKNCLSNLFRFKNSIPITLFTNFLCSNSNITYYGKSEGRLNVRSREHYSLTVLTGKHVICSQR